MTQPRFTSGSAGAFSFDVANHLLDSVGSLQGRDSSGPAKSTGRKDFTIAAQIQEEVDPQSIEWDGEDAQFRRLKVWKWRGLFVGKNSAATSERYVGGYQSADPESQATGLNHGSFGAAPSGYAIQLGGGAVSGDYVMLHQIRSVSPIANERWFAFQGSNDEGKMSMLRIMSSTPISEQSWYYRVQPCRFEFPSGNVPTLVNVGEEANALNLYEPSLYGQPLENVNGRLVVAGPITSGNRVLGIRQASNSAGVALYVFQAPVPLRAECGGPGVMMMQQQSDARFLRDGM